MKLRTAHKLFLGTLLGIAALALAGLIAAVLIFQSGWFKNKIRERMVTEIERTTGARVELERFDYSWPNFTAELSGLVLHGTEAAGSPPLFRARTVRAGFKVISILERRADIASLAVDQPQLHIEVREDGTTNIPKPRAVGRGNVAAQVLNLKIQRFTLASGIAEYNSRQIPLDVEGDDLAADVRYMPSPARYAGSLRSQHLKIAGPSVRDAAFDVEAKIALEQDRLEIASARLRRNESTVEIAGSVVNFSAPRAEFDVKSRLLVGDIAKSIALPVEGRGEVDFDGKAAVEFAPLRYALDGRVKGRGLEYSSKQVRLRNVAITSKLSFVAGILKLTAVDMAAANGHFRGSAVVEQGKRFQLKGNVEGLSAGQLSASSELTGKISGPIEAEGVIANGELHDVKATGTFDIARGEGGVPVEGSVEVNYDQRAGIVRLGNSNLALGATRITASGNLGQALEVHLTSGNLHDLLLALPLAGEQVPTTFPVTLGPHGAARFDGTVTGPLKNPHIAGQLQLTNFRVEEREFNRLSARFEATQTGVNVQALTVYGEGVHGSGEGQIALSNWRPGPQSRVEAKIAAAGEIPQLVGPLQKDLRVTGSVTATATVHGTYSEPAGEAHVQAENLKAYDQPFDRVVADVTYSHETIEVLNGRATYGNAETDFSGAYNSSPKDWKTGRLRLNLVSRGLTLARIPAVTARRQGVDGTVNFQATGAAHFLRGDFQLDELDSQLSLKNAVVDKKPLGDLEATAKTRGQVLDVRADADLRGNKIHGQGEWRFTGDYPGQGAVDIPRMAFAALKDLIPADTGRDLPFGGYLSAAAKVSGPLKNFDGLQAEITIPELQINASPTAQPRAGAQARDLVLRNARPLVFDLTSKGINVRSAQFAGTDTTVQVNGRVGFGEKESWNVRVLGSINLAILQLFNYDLLASGVSTLNASLRGPLAQPELNGRLELKNASLYLSDLPNGVEKANGVIVFDRNRATVQTLSGESGGGAVTFQAGSFVGFSAGLLIYRAQATADHVRYRSPEGVSVTANAALSLAGTSERSTLSGTVTVTRASFMPQTDVGSLLASTAKPVSVPTVPNAYVRGIQFDIRIDSAQNLEVVTSLTRDIQAEANLRLRGNVERPVVLGSLSVTEGEIDFFGNKYSINRCEVNFFNPVKIEPVVDMDLETRVRGITVDITFAGPLDKLNFSYRSDPPLESNQIIALLAVGRQPTGVGALAGSQATTNTSYLATGSNAVLAQAITAPVSGRLQRFFGVSHIKIDPQLTDITSVPQARVTLEQQISKDITLTYVTNLSRTSEQVVRVEWDLSRRWSVVAVRDENGLFGVDFQYRKAFK